MRPDGGACEAPSVGKIFAGRGRLPAYIQAQRQALLGGITQPPHLAQPPAQPQPYPTGVVHIPQPQPYPAASQVVQPPQKPTQGGGTKITIKNISTAKAKISSESKRRTKAATKGKRDLLKRARKAYSALKSQTIKAIRKAKALHYKRENAKIKKMPSTKRKSARAALKKKLTDRLKAFLKKLPSSAKMKLADLKRVQKVASGIKW